MSSQIRKIVIALICVVVLSAAFIILRVVFPPAEVSPSSSGTSTSSAGPEILILGENKNDFISMSVEGVGGNYTLRKTGSNYEIDELENVPVFDSTLSACVEILSEMKARKVVEENAADDVKYGFDQPQAVVTMRFKEDRTYIVEIGDEDESREGFFVRVKGRDIVYLASSGIRTYLLDGAKSFVNLSIFTCTEAESKEIDNIRLSGTVPKEEILIQQNETADASGASIYVSSHVVTKPYPAPIEAVKFSEDLKKLQRIYALGVASLDVSSGKLKAYGLDQPSYIFSFELGEKTVELQYGKKNDAGDYYVRVTGIDVIYEVPDKDIDYIYWTFEDISSRIMIQPMLVNLKSLQIVTEDRVSVFDFEVQDKQLIGVKIQGKPLDVDQFKDFYQSLLGVSVEERAEKPDNAPLYMSITFRYSNGRKDDTLSYYRIDNRKCFAELNGEGTFYVYRSRLDKVIRDMDKVISGEGTIIIN